MFLKRISIFGFKSFREKTILDLPEGLTGIVGPNGCGKSNISEAMRWALGEQNPYLLRAKSMSDVIFNGTAKHKPLGIAEVSLTFLNRSKILPVDYEEVAITRRLFRSGESEYFINKTLCRLKDIVNLFLDTGLGKQAYCLLEQSRVDFVINAKPDQRRNIFEEAAGITKYKFRKQEATTRLKTTEQNLLRINDLISEIESQKNSLYRQAKKAQYYQRVKKELHDAENTLLLDNFQALSQAYHASCSEIEQLGEELNGLKEKLSQLEASFKDTRTDLKLKSEQITQLQSAIFKVREAIQEYHSQILKQKEQKAYFDSQLAYLDNQMQTAKSKQERTNSEIKIEMKKKEELAAELSLSKSDLEKAEAELAGLVQAKKDMSNRLEQTKMDLIDQLNNLAQTRNQLASLEVEVKNIHLRIQRINGEEESLARKDEEIESQLTSFSAQMEEKEDELLVLEKEMENYRQEKVSKEKELVLLDNQINQLREDLRGALSKFQTLEKLQQDMEGYQPGIKTLLKANLDGIETVVANLIEVPVKYEQAIEVALADHLQCLVTQTNSSAKQAIKYLKGQKAERVMFLPLDSLTPGQKPELDDQDLLWALDLIKYDSKYQSVMAYLLQDVLVAENLQEAAALIKKTKSYLKVATLEGELIDSYGIITGGGPKREGLGLISRKRDLTALSSQLQILKNQKPVLESQKEKNQKLLTTLTSKLTETQVRFHSEQIKLSALKKDIAQFNQLKEGYLRQISLLAEEKTELKKEIEVAKTEITQLKGKEERLKAVHLATEQGIAQHQKELNAKEIEIAQKSLLVNQQRVAYAQNFQKQEGIIIHLDRLKAHVSELEDEIKRFQLGYEELISKKARQHDQSALFQEKINELEKQKELEEQKLSLIKGKTQADDELIVAQEQEIKAERDRQEELKNRAHHLEIKKSEFKVQMDNIHQQLAKDYNITQIMEMLEKGVLIADGEKISRTQILEKTNQLKIKLEGMGTVNLLAPSEYESLKKRFDFMHSQQQDLILAKKDLEELIEQIDNTSERLFQETFTAIRSNFAGILKQVFEGGEGELRLTNVSCPEECGVEIEVQPKGKRLQSISLLSAGERSLVAICLLFAIFQHKPSPFCILDEIDAALDEANIIRFNKLLTQFGQKTQFLIVTHNKRTIEFADNLYGVTMEEPGVSKVLSVQLEKKAGERLQDSQKSGRGHAKENEGKE